jgi:hypothetical protein
MERLAFRLRAHADPPGDSQGVHSGCGEYGAVHAGRIPRGGKLRHTPGMYEKRESILERGPRRWRIEPDALVQEFPGGGRTAIRWADVTEVRLRYAPTELKIWRHMFTVRGGGGRIEFDNGHYVGVGDFENRTGAFSAFVGEVLDEVAAKSPRAKLYRGSTPLNYLLLAGPCLLALFFLAYVLWTLPVGVNAGGGIVAAKLALLAFMIPVGMVWAVQAWPRPGTFETLRENLPNVSGVGQS